MSDEADAEQKLQFPDVSELRPTFMEKFDEWKVYQKRCNFATGQGRMYCQFGGHPCAFKLCPMRMYENQYTISTMISEEINGIKSQLKKIEKLLNHVIQEIKKD
jgi:hypothetical protein